MKKLAVLSMAAVLAAGCFVGCGSKNSSSGGGSKYAGKYETAKIVNGDDEYTTDYSGNPIATFLQFELTEDGKAIGWDPDEQKAEDEVGKWTADGDEIKITFEEDESSDDSESDSETMSFKIDGDELIMSEGDGKIYLKKVSEYSTDPASEASED